MQARTHVHEECQSGPVVLFVFNEAELTTYMAVALLSKQKSNEQSNFHGFFVHVAFLFSKQGKSS